MADYIDQARGQWLKFDKMKLFIKTFFLQNPRNILILQGIKLLGSRFTIVTDIQVEVKLIISVYS